MRNKVSLERVQKSAIRIILGNSYKSYEEGLAKLNIQTLEERREALCLNFARKCLTNEKLKSMFPLNEQGNHIKTRHEEKYKVHFAHTGRFQKSPIIYMQKLLNKDEAKKSSF